MESEMPILEILPDDLNKELSRLRELEEVAKGLKHILGFALEKLKLYRAKHSGEYVGGLEFQNLRVRCEEEMARAEKVLGRQ